MPKPWRRWIASFPLKPTPRPLPSVPSMPPPSSSSTASRRCPKVLMGKRHAGLKFMPGKFVFPGGRIEAGDRSMAVTGALHPRAEQALMARVTRPSTQRCRALALAAIRETFEETGLLLGTKDYGSPDKRPGRHGLVRLSGARRVSGPGGPALHRPGHHPAEARQPLRHPLLRRRPHRHRRRGRGHRRPGEPSLWS